MKEETCSSQDGNENAVRSADSLDVSGSVTPKHLSKVVRLSAVWIQCYSASRSGHLVANFTPISATTVAFNTVTKRLSPDED